MRSSDSPTRANASDSHEEDYRWPVLRKSVPKWLFHFLNLTFICKVPLDLHLRYTHLIPDSNHPKPGPDCGCASRVRGCQTASHPPRDIRLRTLRHRARDKRGRVHRR